MGNLKIDNIMFEKKPIPKLDTEDSILQFFISLKDGRRLERMFVELMRPDNGSLRKAYYAGKMIEYMELFMGDGYAIFNQRRD